MKNYLSITEALKLLKEEDLKESPFFSNNADDFEIEIKDEDVDIDCGGMYVYLHDQMGRSYYCDVDGPSSDEVKHVGDCDYDIDWEYDCDGIYLKDVKVYFDKKLIKIDEDGEFCDGGFTLELKHNNSEIKAVGRNDICKLLYLSNTEFEKLKNKIIDACYPVFVKYLEEYISDHAEDFIPEYDPS